MTNLEKLIAENQWRPIEEAPRDGSDILLREGCLDIWNDFWHSYNLGDGKTDGHFEHAEAMNSEPTHFRPLPDDRLAKCADVMMGVIWKVIDNVPLTLQEAQEYLDEALTECEKIARGV